MPGRIGDDEQRGARPAPPLRPTGSGGARAAAAFPLLANAPRHGLRRGAWPRPRRRAERDLEARPETPVLDGTQERSQ